MSNLLSSFYVQEQRVLSPFRLLVRGALVDICFTKKHTTYYYHSKFAHLVRNLIHFIEHVGTY